MPTLTRVYECTDQKLFRDRAVAKRHEAWLELVALCRPIVEHLEIGSPDESLTIISGLLAHELLERGDELRRILRANPVEGGGETNGAGSNG